MYLTKDEEKLLESDDPTLAKCMEILVALGEIFEAERLIPISSAHISGISYANIGEEGLEWIKGLKGKVRVKTTLNPAGMDLERWKDMGIREEFFRKQMEVISALKSLGVDPVLTCTPYYIQKPSFGEHLAWAESSAVVYANSILGARTNRESGISALASAIIGKTPYYGLHVDENRSPTVLVRVKGKVNTSLLGYVLGKELEGIPMFDFDVTPSEDELKHLGASLASTGGVGMFHVVGVTPEWNRYEVPSERLVFEPSDLKFDCEPDLVAIGCPHLSSRELRVIAEFVDRFDRVKIETWLFTSRKVYEECVDIIKKIECKGIKVFRDTCMVVSPATERFDCVLTDSGKALTYLPKLRKVCVGFADTFTCLRRAFGEA